MDKSTSPMVFVMPPYACLRFDVDGLIRDLIIFTVECLDENTNRGPGVDHRSHCSYPGDG
jgi:hypothetical protein